MLCYDRGTVMQFPLSMIRKASVFVCPRSHPICVVLVMSVACHSARAQDDIKSPTLEIPKSGVAQPFPADAAVPSGAADARLFSSIASDSLDMSTSGQVGPISGVEQGLPRT